MLALDLVAACCVQPREVRVEERERPARDTGELRDLQAERIDRFEMPGQPDPRTKTATLERPLFLLGTAPAFRPACRGYDG